MKRKFFNISLLLIVTLLTSCAANSYVAQSKEVDLPQLSIAYNVQSIEIKDSRVNSTSEEIKLPLVSKPNQLIKHVPGLTSTHKEIIERVIKDNTSHTGAPVRAVINIVDSYKEFSATWVSEKERGFAAIQISFLSQESGEQMAGCESSGDFFVESVDATTERMEDVYQITLKNVIHTCLKSIDSQAER